MKGLAAAVLLTALQAGAEPYVALRGGAQWAPRSNTEPLEFDADPGSALGLAVGDEAGLSDIGLPKSDFALDLELEALWQRQALHGRNDGKDHRSADGHDFDSLALMANLWPGWQVTRWLTISIGGGLGAGYAHALGDSDVTWTAQAGASLRANLTPELSLELGERSVWLGDTRHDGYRAEYGSHGVLAGMRWEFKQ